MRARFLLLIAAAFTLLCFSVGKVSAAEPAPTASANAPVNDKWALVVGISSFKEPKLNLKYAAKDATDFSNYLVDKCNFAKDHIRVLINDQATAAKILDALGDSWLPRVALPEDFVVIFISSHGSPSNMDVGGVNYVIAYDTNLDKLFTTAIPLQHLAQTIKERVHCERVLVILDACHSGAASESSKGLVRPSNADAAQLALGSGQMVICSSSKDEASWESKKYPNGIFTHTLMDALGSKGVDTKLSDAFGYLKNGVQKEVLAERGVLQTPVLEASKWKGNDVVLAVIPANPRMVPPGLDAAATSDQEPTASPSTAARSIEQPAAPAVPDISGEFVDAEGSHYHIWQKGRSCGWEMPEYKEMGRGTISDDGKTLSHSWTGKEAGSEVAKLELDAANKVLKIVSPDGEALIRVGDAVAQKAIPNIAGNWVSSNGAHYKIWQKEKEFGWKNPKWNEVALGSINGDNTGVDASWTGVYAGRCSAKFEYDSTGRVVRMVGDNGMTMSRSD